MKQIETQDEAMVIPKVNARWIHMQDDWYNVERKCSHCGNLTVMRPWNTLEECPYCGAKMDGDEHFTEPTEEENKAFDDYYKSIGTKSKENFFDGD